MAARIDKPKGAKPDKLMRDALLVALHRAAKGADGKPTKRLAIVADKLVTKAEEGDVTAIKEIFDRVDGKAPQSMDMAGDMTFMIVTGVARATDSAND